MGRGHGYTAGVDDSGAFGGFGECRRKVQSGREVFAGSYRKLEVVLMSVGQYERLRAGQERAVSSSAASLQMEGLAVTEAERAAAGDLAAGRIDFSEYTRRVDAQ